MASIILLLLFFLKSVHGNLSNDTIEEVFCGDVIQDIIVPNNNHEYALMIFNDTSVNFDTCNSQSDIIIQITNEQDANIVGEYCHERAPGDICGSCNKQTNISNPEYNENFTIPQIRNGVYWIQIQPYKATQITSYQLSISCHPLISIPTMRLFNKTLTCGDSFSGHLIKAYDSEDIYFNLNSSSEYLLIDSCLSRFDTNISLFDQNLDLLYCGDDNGPCDGKDQLLINSTLNPGVYIVRIQGYGSQFGFWHISAACNSTIPLINPSYILVDTALDWTALTAESYCEKVYGTTLATIITEDDMTQVQNMGSANGKNVSLWMGLYKEMLLNDTEWRWMDGTLCCDDIDVAGDANLRKRMLSTKDAKQDDTTKDKYWEKDSDTTKEEDKTDDDGTKYDDGAKDDSTKQDDKTTTTDIINSTAYPWSGFIHISSDSSDPESIEMRLEAANSATDTKSMFLCNGV